MGRVYKLDKEKSLVHQVLSYAGWYEGRKVEIDKIEKYYLKYGYKLNEPAKKFFQEFAGIKESWYFSYKDKKGKIQIGGNDFSFYIPYDLDFDKEDYEYEINQIPLEVRDKVIPIVETGWHIGGSLWIDDTGKVYHTLYYRDDCMEEYDSVFDYLEYNFRNRLGDEICITFETPLDLERE